MRKSISPSMADVARLAGVSPQTVSRVSNDYPGVLEETRERVLAAMTQLRYRPNSAARALKRGSFKTIGVLLSGLNTTGNIRTLNAIVESAAAEGYALAVHSIVAFNDEHIQQAFQRLNESAIDAAILLLELETVDELHIADIPYERVVIVDSNAAGRYPVVDSDQSSGTRAALKHLYGLGHRRIQHVTGPGNSYSSRGRRQTWEAFCSEYDLEQPEPIAGNWSADSGYAAGQRIAEEGWATAVFVSNDEMALGVMRALDEHGLQIPADISVVGFDDIELASQFPTPLTTVRQDFAEIGRRCVAQVLQQIETGDIRTGTELVPATLVVRESTAAPRR